MKKLLIWTDGGARGNPGPAGIGVHICSTDGDVVEDVAEYMGEATNNQAEYTALVRALEVAQNLSASELKIHSDSELMVKQIRGEYRVKNAGIRPLFERAKQLLRNFESYSIEHVRREHNRQADALVNQAIDDHLATS